ncbi:hypothetical protein VKT23_006710 [Stygiomarasmius scandens]|uniref:Uncharacterized protein n=1 Tax=Marasmiellus scandens TaxID=2682957 RepID=A0ABR1JLX2_9AGAR
MESQRRARLMLRIPTQNSRLLRAHHPYKRDLCIPSSHANWPSLNQHVHGADVDRFLEAVSTRRLALTHRSPLDPILERDSFSYSSGSVATSTKPTSTRGC